MAEFKLPENLGQKIGPLPAGVWLVIIGGGIGGYLLYKRRGVVNPSDVRGDEGLGVDTSVPSGVATGPGAPGFIPVTPAPSTEEGDTNEEWGKRVVTYLVSKGYPGTLAQAAVVKYLNGDVLSPNELTMLDAAIEQIGPSPVPPSSVGLPPSNTYTVLHYTGPAVRRDVPEWRDGYAKASRDYSWSEYLDTHYTNVAPVKTVNGGLDVRHTVQSTWLQSVNKMKNRVTKGMVVRIPKYVFVTRPPTG